MKEILASPSITVITPVSLTFAGTAVTTATTAAFDTRNTIGYGATGGIIGAARHVTVLAQHGVSTQKGAVYTLGHAASITDAATNATTLGTITISAATSTDNSIRFECDMIALQPILKLSVAGGTGGSAQSVIVAAQAILSRVEQTPISSSMLASGGVVIIAAGGVTQSN